MKNSTDRSKVKASGRDVGLQRGEQPAGDRRQRAGEQEDRTSSSGFEMPADSAATSASRIATSDAAEAAMRDVRGDPGAEGRQREAEQVEAPRAVERRRHHRADDADAAAGHVLPGQRDLGDDGGEAERRHREVEGAQAQRRQADDHAEDARRHSRPRPRARNTLTGGMTLPATSTLVV